MQQLSFLEPLPQQNTVPVWDVLEEEQRLRLVLRLARLIAKVIGTPGERDDERTDQDHG